MQLFLVLLAAILYAVYDIFVSKGAGKINDYLSATIFNGIGMILPLLIVAFMWGNHQDVQADKSGIWWNVLAGIAIAAFSVVFVKIFAMGGNLSFVIPVIYGGAIIMTSIVGWVMFKEPFSIMALLGIILTTAGITMLSLAKSVNN